MDAIKYCKDIGFSIPDTVQQIVDICNNTDNQWFLTHDPTKIAIYDLIVHYDLLNRNIDPESIHCSCSSSENIECLKCNLNINRFEHLNNLKISKFSNYYDHLTLDFISFKWILHQPIDGVIPGFMLISCSGAEFQEEGFTHSLQFACVKRPYRKQGILKNMVSLIPTHWSLWLEAHSNEIQDVGENVWEKCGFTHFQSFRGHHIYEKSLITA